jgi:hypothetical protein
MLKSTAYPPLDGLLDLACRDGVDIRPTLLRVITDLYVQKPMHRAEEETQYVELALGLIDAVDAPTRAAVAARLSSYRGAPEAVLRRLGVQAARRPMRPAKPPAPTQDDLAALFFTAATSERRLILSNLDFAAKPTAQPPAPASNEMIRRLEAAALTRNPQEFTRLLERALSVAPDIAARIVRDHSGEPIVVAAKALGMKAAVLQRILLFLNPVIGQSVERVYDLAKLYDEITLAAVARMLEIWRDSGARRRPLHAPQLFNDERRGARPSASPTRQADQSRDATATRQRSGIR